MNVDTTYGVIILLFLAHFRRLLTDLHFWSTDKSIENTKLYEPQADSDYLGTYLFNINRSGDYWLVTIWNEVPSTKRELLLL